jgi:LysR family transcriptional regulator, glycine cleavage system transcriptional activator
MFSSAMKKTHPKNTRASPLRSIPPLAALLAFERASSRLSFRLAARDLALSPSAISHQIRGLETLFGVKLFQRGTRSVQLTRDGQEYLEAVTPALKLLNDASRELMFKRREHKDELRISATPFFTSVVLMPALADFRRRHPELTLRIEATHQYADFADRSIDAAIRYGREHSAGLRFDPLVKVRGLPVCAPSLVRSGLRKPKDLARCTLIHLGAQPKAWPSWLAAIGLPDLAPEGNLWFDTVPAMLEAAEHGLGVTLAMAPLIKVRPGFGKTLVAPFDLEAGSQETLYLVSRAEQAKDARIAALRRWMGKAVDVAIDSTR